MIKREPLLTEAYFDQTIQSEEDFLAETEADALLPASEIRHDMVQFDLFRSHFDLFRLKYSRGYSITELKPLYLLIVDALEKYRTFPDADGDAAGLFFNGEQDEYMEAVELLSLGLLLHVEQDVFRRLVDAIGLNGQDYILEWLAGRRLARRPQTTTLLFPKTYARLRDALQAPRDITPPLLKAFLANWYESLDTVWYNIHAHRQDAAGFTGYWCWEAAAAAWAMQVDDTELQAMRYYPKDLADFAFGRQLRPA